MRGININNYAESGIRILKDIVFKRVKLLLLYKQRLLAIAYNRMALRLQQFGFETE